MDELRESLRRGDADAGGEQPVDFAVDDKKMIKKIANLVPLDYYIGVVVLSSTLILYVLTLFKTLIFRMINYSVWVSL
jgi:hypothetical protein